jgi:hypothetical protein
MTLPPKASNQNLILHNENRTNKPWAHYTHFSDQNLKQLAVCYSNLCNRPWRDLQIENHIQVAQGM